MSEGGSSCALSRNTLRVKMQDRKQSSPMIVVEVVLDPVALSLVNFNPRLTHAAAYTVCILHMFIVSTVGWT